MAQKKEKIYFVRKNSEICKSIAMFVFGFVWLVKEVCNIVGNGSFAEADPMSIVFIVFLGYFCFMAAYAAPSKSSPF